MKGNPHVKATLCEATWAAVKSRNTMLSATFWRLASRRGKKRALIATARKILTIVYHIIQEKQGYIEGGKQPRSKGA